MRRECVNMCVNIFRLRPTTHLMASFVIFSFILISLQNYRIEIRQPLYLSLLTNTQDCVCNVVLAILNQPMQCLSNHRYEYYHYFTTNLNVCFFYSSEDLSKYIFLLTRLLLDHFQQEVFTFSRIFLDANQFPVYKLKLCPWAQLNAK